VSNEWQVDDIDIDIQVSILTAVYVSKISSGPLCQALSNLNIEYDDNNSLR
jgi:hypothetical protein